MRFPLALLLSSITSLSRAQPIHNCIDAQGQLAIQDRPCANQPVAPPRKRLSAPTGYPGTYGAPPVDLEQQRRAEGLRHDARAAHADNQRVQELLLHSRNSETSQYAENRRRCDDAKRIALLCGNFSGSYSCDEQGFHLAGSAHAETSGQRRDYKAEQCALRATMGGP